MTEGNGARVGPIVLAYSGGLDASVAIPWLAERYRADIVAVTLDLGQGGLEDVRDRALAIGAVRAHVLDVRDEFARGYVLRSLKTGAVDGDPMATALGRPLIARTLVDIADIEEATAVAHGEAATGRDQALIGAAVRMLNPALLVLAPAGEWGMTRSETLDYARRRHLPVPPDVERPYRTDQNLWGRSIECGPLDDSWAEPPEDVYTLTNSPRDCPDEPALVDIAFDRGVPSAINGVAMPLADLIGSLTIIAGAHGVGRVDRVQNRLAGIRSREICEAPAAVVLHAAHKELQQLVTPRDLDRFASGVSVQYAGIVADGLWFGAFRNALDAFVDHVQERVTGAVRLTLFKGDCRIVGRRSPYALDEREPTAGAAAEHGSGLHIPVLNRSRPSPARATD